MTIRMVLDMKQRETAHHGGMFTIRLLWVGYMAKQRAFMSNNWLTSRQTKPALRMEIGYYMYFIRKA